MTGRAEGTGAGHTGASPRCVVLHRPGHPPPDALLRALERQGLDPVAVADQHLALAEVCRPGPEARRVLLFASPDAAADLDRLARAVDRFVPGGTTWIHDPGANPPVRAFVERVSTTPTPPRPTAPRPRPVSGSPMLRLIDPGPEGPATAPEEEPTTERLLTADELSMLLAEGREKR